MSILKAFKVKSNQLLSSHRNDCTVLTNVVALQVNKTIINKVFGRVLAEQRNQLFFKLVCFQKSKPA
jgi:hypothetical protein